MIMVSAIFRERNRKKEGQEDSAVEKRGSDKHEQWRNLGRWIWKCAAGINSKRICSYSRGLLGFYL